MGAWGVALFSDDLAADIRAGCRRHLGDGRDAGEVVALLSAEYRSSINDDDEQSVFWLSLAATLWQLGRLDGAVKARALGILDSEQDLHRWRADPKQLAGRRTALAKLREQLSAAQPAPKKVPKVFIAANAWEVGELLSFKLSSGRLVLFRVIGHHVDKGGRNAICELLDWVGDTVPDRQELGRLPIKRRTPQASTFMLGEPVGKKPDPKRLTRLGIRTQPAQEPRGFACFPWQLIDRMMRECFGLS